MEHQDVHIEPAGHGTEPFLVEFAELLANPAHWAFEFTTDVAFSLVAYPFIRLVVKALVARHDAKAHPRMVTRKTTAEEANA